MKQQMHLFLILCLITPLSVYIAADQGVSVCSDFATFYEWKEACDRLPKFNEYARSKNKTVLSTAMITDQIDRFFKTMKQHISKISWVNGSKPITIPSTNFQAYVEKLILPEDAVVAIHGDFHGDINAINRFLTTFAERGYLDPLDPFKIKADNFYILFLGDYVDRGWYGAEVLYTVLRLKNENPDRVFFTRGNHEDMQLNAYYEFRSELQQKFSSSIVGKVQALYNVLPLALYIGVKDDLHYNYIQCCHGGIEIGYNPRRLLESSYDHAAQCIDILMRKNGFKILDPFGVDPLKDYFQNNKKIDTSNGFMWSDFFADHNAGISLSPRDDYQGLMFVYGKRETQLLLRQWSNDRHTIRAIFRAHQHSDQGMYDRFLNNDHLGHAQDKGVAKLWIENDCHRNYAALLDDIAVVTFSVAPETGYGWPFHSFGELHIKPDYKDWRLYVYQLKM